jgi:2-polyprenyl-6-methoxyphenol hydroxylase-like FAD-dependent oxidoreductase
VVMCGGTLGVCVALALQQRGWRVAVVERRVVEGRLQEWNSSRHEVQVRGARRASEQRGGGGGGGWGGGEGATQGGAPAGRGRTAQAHTTCMRAHTHTHTHTHRCWPTWVC